jgi:hypothetical protein
LCINVGFKATVFNSQKAWREKNQAGKINITNTQSSIEFEKNCNRKKRRKVKPGRWINAVVVKEYFAHPSQQDGGGVWKTNVCNRLDYVLDSLKERNERQQTITKK